MQRLLWAKSAPKQPKQTMMMVVAEKEEKAGKAKKERRKEERRRRNKLRHFWRKSVLMTVINVFLWLQKLL